jgi:hypothetical protein
MTAHGQDNKEQELKQREKALQDRELAIRLKELEAEIHAKTQVNETPLPPLYTEPVDRSIKHRFKQFLKWSKIVGFTLLGLTLAFIGVFVGIWLVYLSLLGGIVWVSYYLLFGKKHSDRP